MEHDEDVDREKETGFGVDRGRSERMDWSASGLIYM